MQALKGSVNVTTWLRVIEFWPPTRLVRSPATCHGWPQNVSGPSSSGTIVHA